MYPVDLKLPIGGDSPSLPVTVAVMFQTGATCTFRTILLPLVLNNGVEANIDRTWPYLEGLVCLEQLKNGRMSQGPCLSKLKPR